MIKNIRLNNLGTINKNEVRINTDKGDFSLFFSYETLIGISYDYREIINGIPKVQWVKSIIQNQWSTTTGKLLNELEPDKKNRKSKEVFDKEVSEMFDHINS